MKKPAIAILVFTGLFLFISGGESKAEQPIPTHDCTKAGGRMEELLCSEPELTKLSSDVTGASESLKRSRQSSSHYAALLRKMTDEQVRWKNNTRKECILQDTNIYDRTVRTNQIACLKYEYEKRLEMLTRPDISLPLTDSKVNGMIRYLSDKNCGDVYDIAQVEDPAALKEFSCRYFAKHPKKAYDLFGTCFGVNKDSFTPVCDPQDKIKQINGLADYLEQLRHMQGDKSCQGAIKYIHERGEKLTAMMVLYDGDIKAAKIKALNEFDERLSFDSMKGQLPHWSRQGLWEKEQYEKLKELRAQTEDGLKDYYIKAFNWPTEKATTVARFYTIYLANIYLGTTDTTSIEKYSTRSLDLNELNLYLAGKNNVISRNKSNLGYLLRLAVVNGYSADDIERLLEDGAPVEGGYKASMDTPLMQSVKRLDIAELLIQHGANVNAQNEFGKTPLMYAIQYGNKDVVGLLILHDADVNLMTYGKEECGKEDRVIDAGGRTALMYAAWYGTPDIIQALISHGANKHYRDSEDENSYDYLSRNKNMTPEELEQAQQLLAK